MRPARLIAAGCLIAVALSLAAAPGFAAPRLDARFGDGGVAHVTVRLNPGQSILRAQRPVRQGDGKVLVAAEIEADRSDPVQVVVARFHRGGAPDRSFGRGGRVRIGFRWSFGLLTLAPQDDGGILLVGTASPANYMAGLRSQLAVVRLLPNGSRDRTFGTNGVVVWNPPWSSHDVSMEVMPGLAMPQPDGRLLVAAAVHERAPGGPTWSRVVLVRFEPAGSVDESFGRGGTEELEWDGAHISGWARLSDGRVAVVSSRPGGWRLDSFAFDGSADGRLVSDGSSHLGLDVLDELSDLVAGGDGALLMVGEIDIEAPRGPAPAARRILPDGSLDPAFGRGCGDPSVRGGSPGGSPTPDGGLLVTAARLRIHARPRRFDSWAIPYDAAGCVAATPLHLRGLLAGPPLLARGRRALLGASYDGGLALIRIRR
jgi:uncharacterized delta-60 repeat protein